MSDVTKLKSESKFAKFWRCAAQLGLIPSFALFAAFVLLPVRWCPHNIKACVFALNLISFKTWYDCCTLQRDWSSLQNPRYKLLSPQLFSI